MVAWMTNSISQTLPDSGWGMLLYGAVSAGIVQYAAEAGYPAGILAFKGDMPDGWRAAAPVQDYPAIGRSPVAKPALREGDWFLSCFFVKAGYRRSGAMQDLLPHAIGFARHNGAKAIEACPRDAQTGSQVSDLFAGKTSTFLALGSVEIHRKRYDRPLLRWVF